MRGIRTLVVGMLLVGLVALPGVATAQDEPTTPEGVEWKLTGYIDPDAEGASSPEEEEAAEEEEAGEALTPVPLGISATLRLEGGQASGSGGCNTFGGGYTLDGTSLTFSEMTTTLVLCEEDVQQVEDAYLSTLPEVRSWLILEGVLQLADEAGTPLLTFEIPDISLTSSELAGLVAALQTLGTEVAVLRDDLDALDEDVSGIEVERLRNRIRTLETTTRRLGRELDVRAEATPEPQSGFSAAEDVLLQGIPTRIANRCEPLRSGRPDGTRAAVTCTPATEIVDRVDYFLMEGPDAAEAFRDDMAEHDISEAVSDGQTCAEGRRSWMVYLGSGWVAEGCFRAGGVAQLRFVDGATVCRQLPVPGGRRLRSPTILMAVEGSGGDIARVREWAVGDGGDRVTTRLTRLIEPTGQPRTPDCFVGDTVE